MLSRDTGSARTTGEILSTDVLVNMLGDRVTQGQPVIDESVESEVIYDQRFAETPIDRILQRLSRLEVPTKEHFENYLRHKSRINHKMRTLDSSLRQSCSSSTFIES